MTMFLMRKHFTRFYIIPSFMMFLGGCDFFRGYTEGESLEVLQFESQVQNTFQLGALKFLFGSFGHLNTDTLETGALPWKLVGTSLVLYENQAKGIKINPDSLNTILDRFGFYKPQKIGNVSSWNPKFRNHAGLVSGYIERSIPSISIEVVNIGCASCHGGQLYDSNGLPTKTIWLGLPNSNLDLDGYVNTVYKAMLYALKEPAKLLKTVPKVFPNMTRQEIASLENYAIEPGTERLMLLQKSIKKALPFRNGGPGLTNGVASLKVALQVKSDLEDAKEYGYTSIPDLGGTLLKSSLLYDGLYRPKSQKRFEQKSLDKPTSVKELAAITAFFTVPSQRGTPSSAEEAIPEVNQAFDFLKHYAPPPFPGKISFSLAKKGERIFNRDCSKCHGTHQLLSSPKDRALLLTKFPNYWMSANQIKTDPTRASAIEKDLVDAINSSIMGDYLTAKNTNGYVAPPLTGIWATAPYLHNGSVPTVWHLFNPKQRPDQFEVGGHQLDYKKLGIDGQNNGKIYRYKPNFRAYSNKMLMDTSHPGKSNSGHEDQFLHLKEHEKWQLIEYLKLL